VKTLLPQFFYFLWKGVIFLVTRGHSRHITKAQTTKGCTSKYYPVAVSFLPLPYNKKLLVITQHLPPRTNYLANGQCVQVQPVASK